MLGLAKYSPPSWYSDRVREELLEVEEAKTRLEKLSETSDVFFSISRAQYDGFPVDEELPPLCSPRYNLLVYAYMLAKFTMRWAFYLTAARLCKAPNYDMVRETRNPMKDYKLRLIAERYQIDPEKFVRVATRLRRAWPLFP